MLVLEAADDDRTDWPRELEEGQRVGRFLVIRDIDGCRIAVAAGAVSAVRDTDDGTLLLLSGSRTLHVSRPMEIVLAWLDGRPG